MADSLARIRAFEASYGGEVRALTAQRDRFEPVLAGLQSLVGVLDSATSNLVQQREASQAMLTEQRALGDELKGRVAALERTVTALGQEAVAQRGLSADVVTGYKMSISHLGDVGTRVRGLGRLVIASIVVAVAAMLTSGLGALAALVRR